MIQHQYDDVELLRLAKRKNYIPDMAQVTSFPINAEGRTLLIAVDYNPDRQKEASLHCYAARTDGEYSSDGYSLRIYDKQAMIEHACELLRSQLEKLM